MSIILWILSFMLFCLAIYGIRRTVSDAKSKKATSDAERTKSPGFLELLYKISGDCSKLIAVSLLVLGHSLDIEIVRIISWVFLCYALVFDLFSLIRKKAAK